MHLLDELLLEAGEGPSTQGPSPGRPSPLVDRQFLAEMQNCGQLARRLGELPPQQRAEARRRSQVARLHTILAGRPVGSYWRFAPDARTPGEGGPSPPAAEQGSQHVRDPPGGPVEWLQQERAAQEAAEGDHA